MSNPNLGELFTQVWQKINQMKLHVCLSGEYNVTTLVPSIDYPEENTFYLVPESSGNNVYTEWIYINNNWERFGQASIDLSNYVQKTDYANSSTAGVIKIGTTNTGLYLNPTSGVLFTSPANLEDIKEGTTANRPIGPEHQHESAFYGLAKAAGDTSQSTSSNAVGTYTEAAKSAISEMLNGAIAVADISGSATINANAGIRYVCNELTDLDFTPSSTGICKVRFESGSTPTVLTVPNTVKFPTSFDKTSLEANVTYEIIVEDGVYATVNTWS